jgi:hypothetical protein
MKRRLTLVITTALVVMMTSLISSDNLTSAETQLRPVAGTGVVKLGPGQLIRVSVATGDVNGDADIQVRFAQTRYIEQGNIYRVNSRNLSPVITLAPDEAATADSVVDAADLVIWQTSVLSSSRNVRVTAVVVDASTQRVVSVICCPGTLLIP